MTNNDFEVMPRGTTAELQALRQFANQMIAYNSVDGMSTPFEIHDLISKLELWYAGHNERYPSNGF